MTKHLTQRERDNLSAYLDNELRNRQRARLEERLAVDTELRQALVELHRTRAVLRSQPRLRAPRNFTLTAEMVGKVTGQPSKSVWGFGFSLASALASVLFVLVLLGDLLGIPGTGRMMSMPADEIALEQPALEVQMAPEEPEEPAAMLAVPEGEAAPMEKIVPEAGAALTESIPGTAEDEAFETMPMDAGEELATPLMGPEPPAAAAETPYDDLRAFELPAYPPGPGIQEMPEPELELSESADLTQPVAAPDRDGARSAAAEIEQVSWWTPWRIAEFILGGLALVSGIAALWLRIKS